MHRHSTLLLVWLWDNFALVCLASLLLIAAAQPPGLMKGVAWGSFITGAVAMAMVAAASWACRAVAP